MINDKEITISMLSNYTGNVQRDVSLRSFAKAVRDPRKHPDWVQAVARLRKTDKSAEGGKYKSIKSTLPAFTLSCRCEVGKTSGCIVPNSHTGLLCVDIDGGDNPSEEDWAAVRDMLATLNFVYLSALSAGGKGLFLIMPYDIAEGEDAATRHKQVFESVRDLFADKLELVTDKACGNINRLRIYSHDPAAKINPDAANYPCPRQRQPARPTMPTRAHSVHSEQDNDARVAVAVELCCERLQGIDVGYEDWWRIAAALHHTPNGEDYLVQLSSILAKYKGEQDARQKFERVRNIERVGLGTFFHIIERYGITTAMINERLRAKGVNVRGGWHKCDFSGVVLDDEQPDAVEVVQPDDEQPDAVEVAGCDDEQGDGAGEAIDRCHVEVAGGDDITRARELNGLNAPKTPTIAPQSLFAPQVEQSHTESEKTPYSDFNALYGQASDEVISAAVDIYETQCRPDILNDTKSDYLTPIEAFAYACKLFDAFVVE